MTRSLAGLVVAAVVLFGAVLAQAQPDARQMSGIPLPGPELPDGTVSVRVVRGTMTNNLAGQAVTLHAAGRVLQGTTDADGRAQFTGLSAGASVYAETQVDGESLRSQEFQLPARGGVRLALVAGAGLGTATGDAGTTSTPPTAAQPGVVRMAGDSRIIIEFQDDTLAVFYLFDLVNGTTAPVATEGPLILDLPEGAAGAAMMEGASRQASLRGTRLVVTGPFQPGTTAVSLAFTLPFDGAERTLTQRFPVDVERLLVAGERVGGFGFRSAQLGTPQDATSNGTPFVMATAQRIAVGQSLELTLTGLPHRTRLWRDLTVGLGVVVLLAGLWVGLRAPAGVSQATRAALESRRERCFAELAVLEAEHARGRVGEERFAERRAALFSELERLYGELDTGDEGRAA